MHTQSDFKLSFLRSVFITLFATLILAAYPAVFESHASNSGSIRVCALNVNTDGEIVTHGIPSGVFSVVGVATPDSSYSPAVDFTLLPTTSFDTSLALNADLNGDGINEATCVTHEGLGYGTYYYGEVAVNSVFGVSSYNDRDYRAGHIPALFETYGASNVSDGKIVLSYGDDERTLIVSNTVKDISGKSLSSNYRGQFTVSSVSTDTNLLASIFNSTFASVKKVALFAYNSVKDISFSRDAYATDLSTTFTTSGPAGFTFDFDFGDNTPHFTGAYGATFTHNYAPSAHQYTATASYSGTGSGSLVIDISVQNCTGGVSHALVSSNATGGTVSGSGTASIDASSCLNHAPVAVLSAPTPDYVNTSVLMDGSASTDDGAIIAYIWNFGDGSSVLTTTTPTTPHTYTSTGPYTVTLTVKDNNDATASTQKVVTIIAHAQCSDGIDNDGDGKVDFPADLGCTDGNDNDETGPTLYQCNDGVDNGDGDGLKDNLDPTCHSDGNPANPASYTPTLDNENSAPVITLHGSNPTNVTINGLYTEVVTAFDQEDGNRTAQIFTTGGPVVTSAIHTYTLTYNVNDLKGLAAVPQTRVVNIVPIVTECNDAKDNDGDGKIDFGTGTSNDSGCDSTNDNDENGAPVITIIGTIPFNFTVGGTFNPLTHATTTDPENDVVTLVVTSNTVNPAVVGTYLVTYDATDSHGNHAVTKTLVVNVVPTITECNDTIDNDLDGKIDFGTTTSNDAGCDSTTDNSENQPPVITLIGAPSITITVGTAYTDQGATAHDQEDGNITPSIHATGTVAISTVGDYTITYTVADSKGLAATPVTRVVHVVPAGGGHTPQCRDGADNDGDTKADTQDPTCHTDGNPNNPDSYTPDLDNEDSLPVAVLNIPATTLTNTPVTNDGHLSTDTNGTLVLYTWTFGDGSATATTTASTTPHTYTTAGTYTVTLMVTDNHGKNSSVVSKTITITLPTGHVPQCRDGIDNDGDGKTDAADLTCHSDGNPGNPLTYTPDLDDENSAPIAVLNLNPTTALVNTSISNDGTLSTDPDGTIVLYTWDFGNGTATSTTPTIPHTYTNNGTFTVTLMVTDNHGKNSPVVSKTVTITNPVVVVTGGGCSGNCGGGGGGGGAVIPTPILVITNEKLTNGSISGIVLVSWTTNIPANSRVVYDTKSVSVFPVGDQKYGYDKTTVTLDTLVTSHLVAIAGINPNITNYFRPLSRTTSLIANGIELIATPNECYYLRDFLKYGENNDPVEVKKLQAFLNEFDGAHLNISGFFDLATKDAVDHFQNQYKVDVLTPWGHTAPTSYVYLTTRRQVNEIYCKRAFPLNAAQNDEVTAFRAFLEGLKNLGITTPTLEETNTNKFIPERNDTVGQVQGTTDTNVDGVKGSTTIASATNTKTVSGVTNRGNFRNALASAYGAVSGVVINYWLALLFLVLLIPTAVYAKKMLKDETSEEETTE